MTELSIARAIFNSPCTDGSMAFRANASRVIASLRAVSAVAANAQAREYGKKAQDAARQFTPLVERSLEKQPMTTPAGAAVIGFVLGALWKK